MMLESKAWKPSKDALQKGHTEVGQTETFLCVCVIPNREPEQEHILL